MKKCRGLALVVLAIFLFSGCAAAPVSPPPVTEVLPTLTPVQELPTTAPIPTAAKDNAALAAYFADTYAPGYATAAYADLTHDGQNELIVVELFDTDGVTPIEIASVMDASDFYAGRVTVFSLKDGAVEAIYTRDAFFSHVGWMQLYLYTDETGAYLFDYNPSVYQGYADYTYALFCLDASGDVNLKKSNAISFIISDGEDGLTYTDADGNDVSAAVAAFEAEAQSYIDRATPLLVYYEDLYGTVRFDFLDK